MERNVGGILQKTTSWIPEKYAIKGKIIKLKDRDTKEWVGDWEVKLVGTKRIDESEIIERSQDFKNQRKGSDI